MKKKIYTTWHVCAGVSPSYSRLHFFWTKRSLQAVRYVERRIKSKFSASGEILIKQDVVQITNKSQTKYVHIHRASVAMTTSFKISCKLFLNKSSLDMYIYETFRRFRSFFTPSFLFRAVVS